MGLLELDVQITNRCPLQCRHCCCASGPRGFNGPSTDALISLFRQAKGMGVQAVHLTGGEPLLRKDLPDLVSELRRLSLDVEIQSSWFGAERGSRMPCGGDNELAVISLDGLEETHDHYRGNGSFARVITACEAMVRQGRRLRINTIVTRRNAGELPVLLERSGAMGVEVHAFFYFSPIGRGREIAEDWLPPAEMIDAAHRMRDFVTTSHPSRRPPTVYFQVGYATPKDRWTGSIGCRVLPRDFMFVLADGRTVPCSWYIDTEVDCGNAFDTPLASVYESYLGFVHSMEQRSLACRGCSNFAECQGGCDAARLRAETLVDPRCHDPVAYFPGCPERKVRLG